MPFPSPIKDPFGEEKTIAEKNRRRRKRNNQSFSLWNTTRREI